ncbi:MAG: histidine kinase [Porticoccaceae bacterium]|nr:histidine kinase [Porticoccaceae bacterium]
MKTLKIAIIAATLTLGAAPAAIAEVAASATLSSSYLWRGHDLGNGDAALSADVVYSSGGFSGGLWLSSGDASSTEYDLFLGYGGSVGDISYSVGYATYSYPKGTANTKPGDLAEYSYSVGYGPASVTIFDDVDSSYTYTAYGYDAGDFGFTYGEHDGGSDNLSHLDVSYAVNDSLSITMSTVLDSDDTSDDAETTFVASYSLPF